MPTGGLTTRSRAASGISLPARSLPSGRPLRAGPVGPACEVLTGWGQAFVWFSGAGNTRGDAPRLAIHRIERSGLSLKAWPDAEPWGPAVSLARTAAGRRQASCPLPFSPPLAGEGQGGGSAAPAGAAFDSASVGVLLPFFFFLFLSSSVAKGSKQHSERWENGVQAFQLAARFKKSRCGNGLFRRWRCSQRRWQSTRCENCRR